MLIVAYVVIYLLVFIIGICIGSFLNVVIYRVPLGLNIAKGRSFCPKCNNTLTARDLVPLASFGLLRGHCRFCGGKIAARYPLVELVGGILAVICVLTFWLTPQALLVFAATCILTVITFIDIDTQEIPYTLNIILTVLGIIAIFIFPEAGWLSHIIGIFCISVPMIIANFIIPSSFGGGDIFLVAACGLFLGWQGILVGTFIGIIGGGIYGVYLLVGKKKGRKEHFAFGPFLSFGIAVAMFAGSNIVSWYLGFFGF